MKEETISNQDAPTTPSGEQVGSDALLSDLIERIAPYDWQLSAKEAVDNIPADQLADAWHWAATYLVELRGRISSDNANFDRDSPTVLALAESLEISPETLDELFAQGSALSV